MGRSVVLGAAALEALARAMFERVDLSRQHARLVASMLVWADLRGMGSHGVSRIPGYLERIRSGVVDPRPNIEVDRRRAALAVVRAGRAPGQVAFDVATTTAADLARDAGAGWVAVADATHAGAIGYFAQRLARQGLAGVVIASSRPTMAYYGSRTAGVATNPLAIAVPASGGRVIALDMATAVVSRGRLKVHRATGTPLGDDWAIDADGRPTTDPDHAVLPLPLGGAKGAGMSLLFECLGNVMAGSPLVEPTLRGRLDRHAQGGVVTAIDIGAFRDLGLFEADVDALVDAIKELPPAADVDEILVPGERGDRMAEERRRTGIPLPSRTWDELTRAAHELGIDTPSAGAGDA